MAELRREMHAKFDGVDGRLNDVRVGIGVILSYVPKEAPRIFSLRPVDAKWRDVRRLTNERVEVQVWCEETDRPAPGATEVVPFDRT